MTVIATNIVFCIFAVFFLYTGIFSFLKPNDFARALSLEAVGKSGQVEIQAQYGGFFLAGAFSQLAALMGLLMPSTALMLTLVIFGGLIAGRIGALAVSSSDGSLTHTIKGLFYIDGAGAALSLVLLISNDGS